MAAHAKKLKVSPYLILVLVVAIVLAIFFLMKSKWGGLYMGTPTPKPTPKSVSIQAPVQAVVTGPVGSNFLTAKAGPGSGEITLNWVKAAADTDKYSIVYRTDPGSYAYGAVNAVTVISGVSNYSYVVKSLTPGKKYYLAIVPQKTGRSVAVSPEVSAVAP
jgi:ABC-type uncharacterized transport system permease subunit